MNRTNVKIVVVLFFCLAVAAWLIGYANFRVLSPEETLCVDSVLSCRTNAQHMAKLASFYYHQEHDSPKQEDFTNRVDWAIAMKKYGTTEDNDLRVTAHYLYLDASNKKKVFQAEEDTWLVQFNEHQAKRTQHFSNWKLATLILASIGGAFTILLFITSNPDTRHRY